MRKKLFAVIMSVMMMVTFMPAMAFAASNETYHFNNEYTQLVYGDGVDDEYCAKTTKVFDEKTGKVFVTASYDGTIYKTSYYDFTNAYLGLKETDPSKAGYARDVIEADEYLRMIDQESQVTDPTFARHHGHLSDVYDLLGDYVVFVKPAGMKAVKDYENDPATTAPEVEESYAQNASTFKQYVEYTVGLQRYEAYEEVKTLTFPVSAVQTKGNDYEKDSTNVNVLGLDKVKAEYSLYLKTGNSYRYMKIKFAGAPEQSLCTRSGDLVGTYSTQYCAENQNPTVVTKNISLKYSTDFGKTWSDTAPEMINAGEYKFMIKVYRGTKEIADSATAITVVVTQAPLNLEFKAAHLNFLPGTKVSAADVVALKTTKWNDETEKMESVDVFTADKAAADKLFAGCVSLKDFPTQGEDESVKSDNLKVEKIDSLINSDLDVANLFKNYGVLNGRGRYVAGINLPGNEIKVHYAVAYNDITAPNQTKTFHVKKAKALKAKKTFKLKATADYGTLSFTKMSGNGKIKVAKNGTVTVKKGLKKGKYVVKVKVKAPGTHTTKKLTVKVVK